MEDDIQKGLTQLGAFNDVLSKVLTSLGNSVSELKADAEVTRKGLNEIRSNVGLPPSLLEPRIVDRAGGSASDGASSGGVSPEGTSPEGSVPAFSDGLNSIDKLAGVRRTTLEMREELSSFRSYMERQVHEMKEAFPLMLIDALGKFNEPLLDINIPEISAETTPNDVIQILVKRIVILEQRMSAQNALNSVLKMNLKSEFREEDALDLSVQVSSLEKTVLATKNTQAKLDHQFNALNGLMGKHQKVLNVLQARMQYDDLTGDDTWEALPPIMDGVFDSNAVIAPFSPGADGGAAGTAKYKRPPTASQLAKALEALQAQVGGLEAHVTGDISKRVELTEEHAFNSNKSMESMKESLSHIRNELEVLKNKDPEQGGKKGSASTLDMISSAKQMWKKLLGDINVGLDNLHVHALEFDDEKADQHLIPSLSSFRALLLSCLPAFEPLATPELTLEVLYPKLEKLAAEAERLIQIDSDARLPESLGVSFDDLLCADRTYNLAEHINAVCDFSARILDEKVQKISLKRRLDNVEQLVKKKAESGDILDLERDLRGLIASKADVRDVEGILGKKASVAELQQFRELVFNQIEDLRVGGGLAGSPSSRVWEREAGADGAGTGELGKRFELLYRQFQDLMAHCASFVPREEIEAALHTVLTEVKAVKSSYVDAVTLREKLKKKADSSDLDKLLTLLSANLAENERAASALHQKCLVCDKPVGTIAQAPPPPGSPSRSVESAGLFGFDKREEREASKQAARGKRGGGRKGDIKIEAEYSVLKSSIDLPPLGEAAATSANNSNTGNKIKQRVRASAGGGVGPSYTQDTR